MTENINVFIDMGRPLNNQTLIKMAELSQDREAVGNIGRSIRATATMMDYDKIEISFSNGMANIEYILPKYRYN